jgi:hypothetical protein
MKFKKNKNNIFWEGFSTAFDLYGLGFNRINRTNNINASWHKVGGFFTKTFEEYKSLNDDYSNKEEKIKKKRKSQRRLQSY